MTTYSETAISGQTISGSSGTSDFPFTEAQLKHLDENVVKKFEERIKSVDMKSVELMAVFFTLFSFISINVNIFKDVDLTKGLIFMFFMTLFSLVILLTMISLMQKDKKTVYLSIGSFIIFLLIAYLTFSNWRTELKKMNLLTISSCINTCRSK